MNISFEFKTTNNSTVYKKILRKRSEQWFFINCSWCEYHRGCNAMNLRLHKTRKSRTSRSYMRDDDDQTIPRLSKLIRKNVPKG